VTHSVRRRGKKHRLVVEVEFLASSWKKIRRVVDVKA